MNERFLKISVFESFANLIDFYVIILSQNPVKIGPYSTSESNRAYKLWTY